MMILAPQQLVEIIIPRVNQHLHSYHGNMVPSPVGWVDADGVLSLGLESLGITLVASPIHHART
jgi:hypothetical protein